MHHSPPFSSGSDKPPSTTANGSGSDPSTTANAAPQPAPFHATTLAHLLGGPMDGIDDFLVPLHCSRFDLEDGTSYHYSSFATARYGRDTFLHSTLDPLLCAP